MRGRPILNPLVGVLIVSLGILAAIEFVMVALGSPQHVWFWCSILRVCA